MYTDHVVNLVVGRGLPVKVSVEFAEHHVAVGLVFHQLLEPVKLQPAHALALQHVLNQLTTMAMLGVHTLLYSRLLSVGSIEKRSLKEHFKVYLQKSALFFYFTTSE